MAKEYNPRIAEVQTAFQNINKNGHKGTISGKDLPIYPLPCHIQGASVYISPAGKKYTILSHNDHGEAGWILVFDESNLIHKFATPRVGFNHPGGFQIIGDYLCLPVEHEKENRSYVCFYDLSVLDQKKRPTELSYLMRRESDKAGCLGITDIGDGENRRYVMAVADHRVLDFYLSTANSLTDACNTFKFQKTVELKDSYEGMGLVATPNNSVYLIGFGFSDKGLRDRIDLYEVGSNFGIHLLDHKHMVTAYGGTVGIAGVHFRWGTGLYFGPTGLRIVTTARNIVSGVTINDFHPGPK